MSSFTKLRAACCCVLALAICIAGCKEGTKVAENNDNAATKPASQESHTSSPEAAKQRDQAVVADRTTPKAKPMVRDSRANAGDIEAADEAEDDSAADETVTSADDGESEADAGTSNDSKLAAKNKKPTAKKKATLPAVAEATGETGTEPGDTIPEIEGSDVDGEEFALSDYEGKVVMLDFWGDW